MKKLIASILFLFTAFITAQEGSNQYTLKGTPLDVITDAKTISMGESFVANNNSPNSFFENPAAISNNSLSFFYNYRYHGWASSFEDMNYSSAGVSLSAPFGKFAFSFYKFSSGEISLGSDNSYELTRTLYSLIFSKDIIDNLTIGFGLKFFNSKTISSPSGSEDFKSNTPTLIDFGILYEIKEIINSPAYKDKLSFGLSVQNFGNEMEETNAAYPDIVLKNELAKYARVGFAYETKMILGEKMQVNVDVSITGEYQKLLNPGYDEKFNVDYWGAGAEIKFFKIISVRAGAVVPPTNSLLHERGKLNWRYGAGLNYPLFILDKPFAISFDYTYIPISSDQTEIDFINARDNLYAFSFSLSYNGKLFN